jgi:TonB family protein
MTSRVFSAVAVTVLLGCTPAAICAEKPAKTQAKTAFSTQTPNGSKAEQAQWKKALEEAASANELLKQRQFTEAEAIYNRSLDTLGKQNQLSSVVYSFRGLAYLIQDKKQAALDDFDAALKLLSGSDADLKAVQNEKTQFNILIISVKGKYFSSYLLGKYEEAAECNLKLCKLCKWNPKEAATAHLDAAVLYILAAQSEKSKNEIKAALLADPKVQEEADAITNMRRKCETVNNEKRKSLLDYFDKRINSDMKPFLASFLTPEAAAKLGGASSNGPLSQYCHNLAEKIKSTWKALPELKDSIDLDLKVDQEGNVIDVTVPKVCEQLPEPVKKAAVQRLMTLKNLGALSEDVKSPLWLRVHLSNQVAKIFARKRDLDLSPFMAELQKRIKSAWYPPERNDGQHVTAVFKVGSDGQISAVKLSEPSGVAEVDNAALAALAKAGPLPPPDGSPDFLDVEFKFDAKVGPDRAGGNSRSSNKAAGGSLRNRVITEDNQSQIWEELKSNPDVTLAQYKVLLQNAQRSGDNSPTPHLPVGRTIGDLLDEQMKAEQNSQDKFKQEQIMMEDAAEAKDPVRKLIKVEVLRATYSQQKPAIPNRHGYDESTLTLTLRCSNPSTQDITKYHGVIDFKNGADYLTGVTIVRGDGLKAGETKTISQTFRDDEPNDAWSRLADSNLSSLRIRWKPWKVTLSDGTLLMGTME